MQRVKEKKVGSQEKSLKWINFLRLHRSHMIIKVLTDCENFPQNPFNLYNSDASGLNTK